MIRDLITQHSPVAALAVALVIIILWFVLKNLVKLIFWLFILGLLGAIYVHCEGPSEVPVRSGGRTI